MSFFLNPAKDIARGDARGLAENFGGKGRDAGLFRDQFRHMWELTWRAKLYSEDNETAMKSAVTSNLNALGDIVAEIENGSQLLTGHVAQRSADAGRSALRTYRTARSGDKYVVFSDVHIIDRGNRQDFFEQTNKALYLDVLAAYYAPNEWALVENGDIEELLIFEPDLATMPDFEHDDWEDVMDDREERKWAQFGRIIGDHADYYRMVHDGFIARGAYFRTIGNHDYDLALSRYADEIADGLSIEWPRATDMLLLVDDGEVGTIICHGHQFDAYCVAAHAPYAGESFSQGSAWAFQGPDRHWTLALDGSAFILPWLDGTKTFNNMLVTDEPEDKDVFLGMVGLLAGYAAGNLHDTASWERLFGKNVAWDYFAHSDPQDAFDHEVKTGQRWYKYRHMNEILIVDRLEAQFGTSGPQLLLGHSHEPRIRAGKPGPITQVAARAGGYLNSAAAGRFENLIWGIELVEGVATMISWSRDNDGASMIRTVWTDHDIANQRMLHASSRTIHSNVPAQVSVPETKDDFDTVPITNMMFS